MNRIEKISLLFIILSIAFISCKDVEVIEGERDEIVIDLTNFDESIEERIPEETNNSTYDERAPIVCPTFVQEKESVDLGYPYQASSCFVARDRPPTPKVSKALTCVPLEDLFDEFNGGINYLSISATECDRLPRTTGNCKRLKALRKGHDYYFDLENQKICIDSDINNICLQKDENCARFYDVEIPTSKCTPKSATASIIVAMSRRALNGYFVTCRPDYNGEKVDLNLLRWYKFESGAEGVDSIAGENLNLYGSWDIVPGVQGGAMNFHYGAGGQVFYPNGLIDMTIAFVIKTTFHSNFDRNHNLWYQNAAAPMCADIGGQGWNDWCMTLTGDELTYVEGIDSNLHPTDYQDKPFWSNTPINDGKWHHIAVTRIEDDTKANIDFYVDGKLVSHGTTYKGMRDNLNLILGSLLMPIDWTIDELKFYRKGIPQSKIISEMKKYSYFAKKLALSGTH